MKNTKKTNRFFDFIEREAKKFRLSALGSVVAFVAIILIYEREFTIGALTFLGFAAFVSIDVSLNSIKRRLDRIEKAMDREDRDATSDLPNSELRE